MKAMHVKKTEKFTKICKKSKKLNKFANIQKNPKIEKKR